MDRYDAPEVVIRDLRRFAEGMRIDRRNTVAGSDIVTALQKVRDARNLDPEVEGANELNATLTEQARAQGEAAITSAKNYENRNRTDQAIKEYERVASRVRSGSQGSGTRTPAPRTTEGRKVDRIRPTPRCF